jgi:very-short-patch-repair endonuclease
MHDYPSLSHGVVTMNQPQREQIEAEIDRLTLSDPVAAKYREHWGNELEPPFVKNLENVQGDERDVILISLGWGRTPERAMHQRFFPINRRDDGHRRLNVLFTRAKRKVVLFASLRPEDIVVDPERTAPGVRVLRDYLQYARDGRLERGVLTGGEADSPFETSVANALRSRGHDVALQVGVAGYSIDIGVRHPSQPGRFVLGVECDGATYHSAKSARDRDRLRQEALERLGWYLARVWSTDWFRDPTSEADRISALVRQAIAAITINRGEDVRLVPQDGSREGISPADSATMRLMQRIRVLPPPLDRPGELPLHATPPAPSPQASVGTQTVVALRVFRDEVIMRDLPGSEPNRCILREDMIKAIVQTGLDDPDDFHAKIPTWLRSKTDGRQMIYLERICELVTDRG